MTEDRNWPSLTDYIVVMNDKKTGRHQWYYESSETSADNRKALVLKELQERFEVVIYKKKEGQ